MVFLITVFVFAIVLFIFAFIIPTIADGLKTAGMNESSEGAQAIDEMGEIGSITMQRGFFLLMVGLIISTMITSFLVRTHPIFIFLYILFLGITILLSVYLGDAYDKLVATPIFADTLASQTFINLVMSNINIITLAVGAMSIIIVFAKFSSFRGRQPGL